MSVKIYREGSSLIVDDSNSSRKLEDHAVDVNIYAASEQQGGSGSYVVEGPKIGSKVYEIGPDLQDESGTVYTATTFEEFYRFNTGVNFNTVAGGSVTGFGVYNDDGSTPQTFTSTASKVLINGLAAGNEDFLPLEIRGTGSLYDTSSDLITPISVGDTYDFRLSMEMTGSTSNPTRVELIIDIGGGATPTIIVANDSKTLKTGAQPILFTLPYYTLETFITNGGQMFITVNSGTITVSTKNLYIERKSKNSI